MQDIHSEGGAAATASGESSNIQRVVPKDGNPFAPQGNNPFAPKSDNSAPPMGGNPFTNESANEDKAVATKEAPSTEIESSSPEPAPREISSEFGDEFMNAIQDADIESNIKEIALMSDVLATLPTSETKQEPVQPFQDAFGRGARAGSVLLTAQDLDNAMNFDRLDADLARFSQNSVISAALSTGVDLRQYSRQIDSELRQMESASIADYVKESDSIAELFYQISSCESILDTMTTLLNNFQTSLGDVSDEIRDLLRKSSELTGRMTNRKNLGIRLVNFLDKVGVTENLIRTITEGNIEDQEFAQALRALSEKLEFIQSIHIDDRSPITRDPNIKRPKLPVNEPSLFLWEENPLETPAGAAAVPELEKLRNVTANRIFKFLQSRVQEVVAPKTNISIGQTARLLPFGYHCAFLLQHTPAIGAKIRSMYTEGITARYCEIFKSYITGMMGFLEPMAPGTHADFAIDSLSLEPPGIYDNLTILKGRHKILSDLHAPAPRIADMTAEGTKRKIEYVFRAATRHLIDVAGAEETFSKRFFGQKEASQSLSICFTKVSGVLLDTFEEYVLKSKDVLELTLMLAISEYMRKSIPENTVPFLHGYFDRVKQLFSSRVQSLLREVIASLRQVRPNITKLFPTIRGTGENYSLYFPLPLVKRASLLTASILSLYSNYLSDVNCAELQDVSRQFITTVEQLFVSLSSTVESPLSRQMLLINQYTFIISSFQSAGVSDANVNPLLAKHAQVLKELSLQALSAYIPSWKDWVLRTEALPAGTPPNADEASIAVLDFSRTWRSALSNINNDIKKYTAWVQQPGVEKTPILNSSLLLKAMFDMFIDFHLRGTNILTKSFPISSGAKYPWLREVITQQTLLREALQYGENALGLT